MTQRPKPFNNPFSELKLEKPVSKSNAPSAPPPAPKVRPASSSSLEDDEAALFLASVGEVAPVRSRAPVSAPPPPVNRPVRVPDPEEGALTELAELVAGHGPLDLADTDEYVEGHVPGLDARILKRLRAGEYAVQAHLDLHGLTRAAAKAALEVFVLGAQRRGQRCLLVVHGRGLHSKDQIPVLKEGVQLWLSRGRIGARVLAFTSARPHDGGAGAVYVLLRR